MMKWLLFIVLALLCFAPIVAAQSDCPSLVDAAFAATNEICAGIGRNQACYGNVLLNATPREDTAAFSFEQAGDIVNVADIESLQLSSMSLTDETWGVALMLLQANLPDTLPGQNVTVVMFGDTALENHVERVVEFNARASGNVNVRLRPTTEAQNVIASLTRGQEVVANGRLADGAWIRIEVEGDARGVGWVSADFLSSESDFNTLTIIDPDAVVYAPMQAFYFASSIGDSQCEEAPASGMLIQTPDGVGEVNLLINEVDIQLGSTVYVQAGGGVMTVTVVEGHAVLSVGDVSQIVPEGTYAQIPLDTRGVASGTPGYPQPYNYNALQALPVQGVLPQAVEIAPALTQDEIETGIATVADLPLEVRGTWTLNQEAITICDIGFIDVVTLQVEVAIDNGVLYAFGEMTALGNDGFQQAVPFRGTPSFGGVSVVETYYRVVRFVSATSAEGEIVGNYAAADGRVCDVTAPFTMTR